MAIRPPVLAAAVFTFSLLAQTPDTATLRGHVTDRSDAAMPGARVTAVNRLTGLRRESKTDRSGQFSFGGLPVAGNYDITASKRNFADAVVPETTLASGTTADIAIRLDVAGGQERVTVTGTAGEVRADNPNLASG